MFGKVARMAGSKVGPALLNTLRSGNPKSNLALDLAMQFGPDAAFGVLQGAMTPGDMREKLIAGTSTAVGGSLGGLGLSAALGPKLRKQYGSAKSTELPGGIAGDALGQGVGDSLQRMTAKDGKTAYERVGDKQRREIEQQTLSALGLAGYNLSDLAGYM